MDHILVSCERKRSRDAARRLAYDLLDRLEAGADWTELKREYDDGPVPGAPPAMCDVALSLERGAYGVADHDERTSWSGYHVVKRVV